MAAPDYPELQTKSSPSLPTPPRAREATPEEVTTWRRGLLDSITELSRNARDDLLTTVRPDANGFYNFGANQQMSIQPVEAGNSIQGMRFKYGNVAGWSWFNDDGANSFCLGWSNSAEDPVANHTPLLEIVAASITSYIPTWVQDANSNDANGGTLLFQKSRAGGAVSDWDWSGKIDFKARNSANSDVTYGAIYGWVANKTVGNEAGQLGLYVRDSAGNIAQSLNVTSLGIYVALDCSALTFTDRTKAFEGDALAELTKIQSKDGEIDHATLPAFASKSLEVGVYEEGKKGELTRVGTEIVPGRDLSAMVSMLTVAVQQLAARVEALEGKLV